MKSFIIGAYAGQSEGHSHNSGRFGARAMFEE